LSVLGEDRGIRLVSVAPQGPCASSTLLPTAGAVGCSLSPLRGSLVYGAAQSGWRYKTRLKNHCSQKIIRRIWIPRRSGVPLGTTAH